MDNVIDFQGFKDYCSMHFIVTELAIAFTDG